MLILELGGPEAELSKATLSLQEFSLFLNLHWHTKELSKEDLCHLNRSEFPGENGADTSEFHI